MMVEAAGQRICLFRDRLDYAFTPTEAGGGACYPDVTARILVPAPLHAAQPVYESLQGSPEVGPLATPRRYLVPPSSARQASPM
jgi:hypothetical protein